jgi:N-methylhydantoinase A/oxoprolinase/acetone carboxylase beta subunit
MSGISVGIDIGGTFDVICVGAAETHIMKVPSTCSDPSQAVQVALDRLAAQHGVPAAASERFCQSITAEAAGDCLPHARARRLRRTSPTAK